MRIVFVFSGRCNLLNCLIYSQVIYAYLIIGSSVSQYQVTAEDKFTLSLNERLELLSTFACLIHAEFKIFVLSLFWD